MTPPVSVVDRAVQLARRSLSPKWLPALTAVVMLASMLSAAPAVADRHPVHRGIVSANPADNTPDVLDGHVNAFVRVGTMIVVGGQFNHVAQGGVTYSRQNLFAYDAVTGAVSTTFRPHAFGEVNDLLLRPGRRSVYAVGDFSSINRHPRTKRAARLQLDTGRVEPGFRPPRLDRTVNDIAYARGRLYLAGDFTDVGRHHRSYLIALDSAGRDTGTAGVRLSGTNRKGRPHVVAMDIAPNDRRIAIVGNFRLVDGQHRPQVALLKLAKRHTPLASWSTRRFAPVCNRHFDTYMRGVAFSPTSRYFIIVTSGGPEGGQSSGQLCDTASRWNVGVGPGQQPAWVDYTGGDTLTAVTVDRNVVYVGGHQRWFNNSYGHNSAGPGAVERPGIAALDPLNGLPLGWNPGRPRGVGVSGFALVKQGLLVGHDTNQFGGEPHQRLAFLPMDHANPLPAYQTGKLPGTLTLLGQGSTNRVQTRTFNGKATGLPTFVASTQQWQDVRGTFVVDDRLYAGWSNGRLTTQSYHGGSLGAPSEVSLQHGFPDLARVRSMFFDRHSHRLYYTLTGTDKLFYRYFQPQSDIVGSWRYRAGAHSAVDWNRVGGAFLVGNTLYFTDAPTGQLRSIAWNARTAKTAGKPRTLAGPHVDHKNYRSRGLVLSN